VYQSAKLLTPHEYISNENIGSLRNIVNKAEIETSMIADKYRTMTSFENLRNKKNYLL
jgi:hypothetical protein